MGNFLTRLELQGFKSFASKTEFEFDSPVVGVVGPNGSGKSNIIDAIRWVLGEREAKHLRGDSLENLVFAGTSGKSPASLARVSLFFNNESGFLPIEAQEVSVSRRIDRTGTSQFYINNQEVRLKDLVSVLAKARLGSRGFTIISQGEADVFVRVNSQERREMIEEVLGLKEFRLKKKTAERQLVQARVNMEQLEASLTELTPHLKFLRRQRNKWEKRSEIEEEINVISKKYFGCQYHKFVEFIKRTEKEIDGLIEGKKEVSKKVALLQNKLKTEDVPREKEMKEVREALERLRRERLEAEKASARAEARLEYSKEKKEEPKSREHSSSFLLSKIKYFVEEISPAVDSGNLERIKDLLEKWLGTFKDLFVAEEKQGEEPEKAEISLQEKKELEKINNEIIRIDKLIKEAEEKESEILSFREEESRKFREEVEKLEDEKNNERKIEDEIRKKEMDKERFEFRFRELKNKWLSLGFSLEKLENLEKPQEDEEEGNLEELEIKINRLSSKLSAIGEIDEGLVEEAKETEERYELYVRELEDLKKASTDLKNLISELEEKIHKTFKEMFGLINKEFNNYFRLMFGGGKAKLKLVYPQKNSSSEESEEQFPEEAKSEEKENITGGVDISLTLPNKKVSGLDMLSGGEKTLVSIAALFALISVSPPPFLVLDEIDAALDDKNTHRFSELIKEFSEKSQFIVVTHNKITMESAQTLYGVTMGDDGVSKILSLRFQD
jgi:chromosome segregation ATPase